MAAEGDYGRTVQLTHRVVALAVPTVLLLDLAAPSQIFGSLDHYEFELAGLTPGPIPASFGTSLFAERGLEALEDADTIVIPGLDRWATDRFPEAVEPLRRAYERGARIMSICTGAFILGDAGLLNGRRVTTHWVASELLASRFPEAHVDPDVLYIDEGKVLTSAGVAAGLDLCLHVVRQDLGAAVAADAARWSVIAPFREGGQAQFIPAAPITPSTSPSTYAARAWALEHLNEPVSIDQLARISRMSRRTFTRRFLAEVGTTPAQWILEQRLRAAQSRLETTTESVDQIALETGFATSAALRAHFQRRLHTTPSAYRKTFAGPAAAAAAAASA
jgi:transcriptional regulator GlxA family with amidase domain